MTKTILSLGPADILLQDGGSSPLTEVSAELLFFTISEPQIFPVFPSLSRESLALSSSSSPFLTAPAPDCTRKMFYGTWIEDIMGHKLSLLE